MERSFLPVIAGYINRPRIDALIAKSLDYSLVQVIAGPGYGKTLSVASFLKDADIRLIWLRISGTRTKAADFWDDLIKAVRRELPPYAAKLEELGFPHSAGSFERFREIAADSIGDGKRLVLVVDNYERILDDGITQFLNSVIDSDLPNFTMFLLCNAILPFAEVFPATGQFRMTDETLAFTLDEAKMMFEQYGATASPDILERAVRVTGGWPLGLRLVCESNPENPEAFSSRSPLQITSDLYERHYFRNYPKDIRVQLVLFSLLQQFSLDMAQPSVETPKATLAAILMQHPFITYDYHSGLFTFQAMYHDFLRQKQSLLSMEARVRTTASAGRWFLAHEMRNEAMDCFWETADYDRFIEILMNLPKLRRPAEITNRILQRLEQIPRDYADSRPEVDYCIAYMHLNAADSHKARTMFLALEKRLLALPDSEERRLMLGDIYATLADISTSLNEDTGLAWLKKAKEQTPNGDRVHSPALLSLGNMSMFFLPNNEEGQLERMVDYFFEYSKYTDIVESGCGHGAEYLFAGEAAYYRENMDHAAAMFNSAIIKAQRAGQHDIICKALWDLGRIEFYYGNHKNALALLGEMEAYMAENSFVDMQELRDCAIAFFYMRLEDIAKIPSWFGDIMTGSEPPPLSSARKQLTSAYYLYMKDEKAKSFAVLLQLEAFMKDKGGWIETFYLHLLMAQHYMSIGEAALFERAFRTSYDMIRKNNLKLCLSAAGKGMMTMLDYLKRLGVGGYDTQWLDEVYQDAVSMAKRLHRMQLAYKGGDRSHRSAIALTKREDETLHYLAQGLTQKEIGKLMGISANAVKKHISKIYFKLGAVNRADAIHIATVNGLVDVFNS